MGISLLNLSKNLPLFQEKKARKIRHKLKKKLQFFLFFLKKNYGEIPKFFEIFSIIKELFLNSRKYFLIQWRFKVTVDFLIFMVIIFLSVPTR